MKSPGLLGIAIFQQYSCNLPIRDRKIRSPVIPGSRNNKMTAQERFWSWFIQHEVKLFDLDPDQENGLERLFDHVATELQKVHPDLTFEFGPKGPIREFVISAGGIRDAFPAVVCLTQAAPTIERWQITAFRPRRTTINIVEFKGKRVDPQDVQFSLLDNGKVAGLYLFMPGFHEDDADLEQVGYLLLDEALGEYDVEARLGLIRILSPDTRTEMVRYPLTELPRLFDQLVSRLEGRTGVPS